MHSEIKHMKFLDVPQSGSIADRTHSHNRAGQYTRNRRAPVQPVGTGRRAVVRARFGQASLGWSTLTSAQRAAWDSFALDHPIRDALGQQVILTGHQMYVRVTASALNVGIAPAATPPATLALPTVGSAAFTFDLVSGIEIDGVGGDIDGVVAIAFSRPVSAGRSFMKTFWQPPGADGYCLQSAFPKNVTTATYAAQFGTVVAGQKVFCRLTPVSADGWNGTPTILQTIVTP